MSLYVCMNCNKIKKIQKSSPVLRVTERQEEDSKRVLEELLKVKRSMQLVSEDARIWLDRAIKEGFDQQSINDLIIKFDVVKKHIVGRFAVFIDPDEKNILVSAMRLKQVEALELKVRQFVRKHNIWDKHYIDDQIRKAKVNTKEHSAEENLELLLIDLQKDVKAYHREQQGKKK